MSDCHWGATAPSCGGTKSSPFGTIGATPVALTIVLRLARTLGLARTRPTGDQMESNLRFYRRRAAEERTAALRAMTPQARDWHASLALEFAARADVAQPALTA